MYILSRIWLISPVYHPELLFESNEDTELRNRINVLEKAFKGHLTSAEYQELNKSRRNGVVGENLVKSLMDIYWQHNMKDWSTSLPSLRQEEIPRVVCSEELTA